MCDEYRNLVLSVTSIESCVVYGEYRNLVSGAYRNVMLSMASIKILCCVDLMVCVLRLRSCVTY